MYIRKNDLHVVGDKNANCILQYIYTMFNVDITGTFNGIFPSNIPVSSRNHAAAVRHYKSALWARQVNSSSGRVVLESAYGFQFRVDAQSSSSSSRICPSEWYISLRSNICAIVPAVYSPVSIISDTSTSPEYLEQASARASWASSPRAVSNGLPSNC